MFEAWDNRFHYAIAAATKNKLLDDPVRDPERGTAFAGVADGARRRCSRVAYTTFSEHEAIYDAIVRHDEPTRPSICASTCSR